MYRHGGDIYTYRPRVDFSASINFRGMPLSACEAAREAIAASAHYPDVRCRELRRAVAEKEGVPPDAVFCGNGATDVLFSLVQAARPRRALLPVPSFFEYRRALRLAGHGGQTDWPRETEKRNIEICFLREEDGFALNERIIGRITPDADMLILCNPQNPTGLLTERGLLGRILCECERTGTLLVVDECFMDLVREPGRHTMLPYIERGGNLFIVRAFTKSYAMPGLRLGYGICADSALLCRMEEVSQPWRVSVPAAAAGIEAARERGYLQASRKEIAALRKDMSAGLRGLGCEVWDSAANFIFFKGETGLAERLAGKGILIRDCANFEGLTPGYYRAAVRSKEENEMLLRALRE